MKKPVDFDMGMSFMLLVSKIMGIFPYNDYGLSKIWMAISVFIQTFTTCALIRYISIAVRMKLTSIIDVLFMFLMSFQVMIHLFRILTNHNFYKLMKPLIDRETTDVVEFAIFTAELSSKIGLTVLGITHGVNYLKLFLFTTYLSRILIALHYASSINLKSKELTELRQLIINCPEVASDRLHQISQLVEEIHRLFCPQLLVMEFNLLCGLVVILFYTLSHSCYYPHFVCIGFVFEYAFWVLYICRSCTLFNTQVKAFYDELFRVVWEKNLCSNKKLRLYLKIQRKVDFSVCGFFTLGYPLVTSVITAVTTYLVILIQYN